MMLRNAALHRAVLAADQPAHLPVGVLPRSMPSMRSCLKTQIGLGFQGRPTLLLRAAAEPAAQTAERGLYSKIQDPEPGQVQRNGVRHRASCTKQRHPERAQDK
eukprot:1150435-Pelagomonas_calceolata.AAC.2